jgi:hypothetical protein
MIVLEQQRAIAALKEQVELLRCEARSVASGEDGVGVEYQRLGSHDSGEEDEDEDEDEDAGPMPLDAKAVWWGGGVPELEVRSIHWSPYDRVRVVNADP